MRRAIRGVLHWIADLRRVISVCSRGAEHSGRCFTANFNDLYSQGLAGHPSADRSAVMDGPRVEGAQGTRAPPSSNQVIRVDLRPALAAARRPDPVPGRRRS
jgi:hypothetical protein